ncbi:MAG: NAD-dependent epimerase/dehydratase family protein [Candidatus Omnitrophica bacterium]|nr:NAD-dependent epimerase/dehydratase family protein [Candidatus Omnitrophota bacterium]
MAIFLTGGSGFIGSHLLETLGQEGVPIIALAHRRPLTPSAIEASVKVIQGDITESDWIDQVHAPIDVIYHLAGISGPVQGIEDPLLMTRINVLGTQQVLEAARRWKIKQMIVASSSYVYGDAPSYPLREEFPLHPTSPLGGTKAGMEALCRVYGYCYGVPFTLLRIFTVYGPGSGRHQFAIQAIQKVTEKKEIRFGSSKPTRDFVYIDDVVRALLAARGVREPRAVFNVGTGVETSIRQFVETLLKIAGRSAEEVVFDETSVRADEKRNPSRQVASLDRVREELSWSPQVSLEEGLRRTYAAEKKELLHNP